MTEHPIERWIVEVRGERADLETLAAAFEGQPVHFVRWKDGHALSIPVEHGGSDHTVVADIAERTCALANGIGRLLDRHFAPVTPQSGCSGVDSLGEVRHVNLAPEVVEAKFRVLPPRVIIDGVMQPDPRQSRTNDLIREAEASPHVTDALTILGRGALTWPELYILYELVEKDSRPMHVEQGWISKSDAARFKHTANNYDTVGIAGRHGPRNQAPPANPMSLGEARRVIHRLTDQWLAGRPTAEDGPPTD